MWISLFEISEDTVAWFDWAKREFDSFGEFDSAKGEFVEQQGSTGSTVVDTFTIPLEELLFSGIFLFTSKLLKLIKIFILESINF